MLLYPHDSFYTSRVVPKALVLVQRIINSPAFSVGSVEMISLQLLLTLSFASSSVIDGSNMAFSTDGKLAMIAIICVVGFYKLR